MPKQAKCETDICLNKKPDENGYGESNRQQFGFRIVRSKVPVISRYQLFTPILY